MKHRFLLIAALLASAACHEAVHPAAQAGQKSFDADETKWRETRRKSLTKETGWLSLVGLDWLHEGANDVKLPSTPPVVAHVTIAGAKATLQPDPAMIVDGKPIAAPLDLKDDGAAAPTVVHVGSLTFLFIKPPDKNGERYA